MRPEARSAASMASGIARSDNEALGTATRSVDCAPGRCSANSRWPASAALVVRRRGCTAGISTEA